MGFSSQAGHLLVRTYAGGATFPADLATAGVGYRLRSGTLGPNRELLIPDPEIGGSRDIADAYLGAVSWAGDLEFYARLAQIGTLLNAALGADTISGGPAPAAFTHTITPSDGAMPWLAIEERVGNGFETFHYTDVVANTLHLEAEANGYLMGTVGLIAKKQVAGATPVADPGAIIDSSPMVVGTNITVTYNGITLPAKSFSLDVNNNFEDDDFRLGSFYIGDLTPKRREVTAGFSIRPQDSALWRQAVYGTTTATEAGGLVTKQALVITASTYEDIPGTTPAAKYSLQLTIPKAAFTPFSVEPSGDDIIEYDMEVQALRPDNAQSIITAAVTTDAATIA